MNTTPAATLCNYICINNSWWNFLENLFSNQNPLCAEHAVIAEYYKHSYKVYKYLKLNSNQWFAKGCNKNVFLVDSVSKNVGLINYYIGKVNWQPKFPVVIKLYAGSTLENFIREKFYYNKIMQSEYCNLIIPHKFYKNFSTSPYITNKIPDKYAQTLGSKLPSKLRKWTYRDLFFQRSRRYGDKSNKIYYRLNDSAKYHAQHNIVLYNNYPAWVDVEDFIYSNKKIKHHISFYKKE